MEGEVGIAKYDDARQLVFGWANVSIRTSGALVSDWQEDMIDVQTLEDAAYLFNLEFRETGEMHAGVAKGRMIESMVFTKEKLVALGLAENALPQAWWVGFYVEDPETFAKVRSGKYKMFSIHGTAKRVKV